MKKILLLLFMLSGVFTAYAQPKPDTTIGKYNYIYVGEWDTRHPEKQSLYIIENGKVTFDYGIPMRDEWNRVQEFDDVKMLPDGNILYAALSQLGIVNRKGELVWQYICPQGTESHSCQPIDKDRVYFALNGVPGKIVIWNIRENKPEKEIIVPTAGTNTHGQFRHVRRTPQGTFVTGLLPEKKVIEIDEDGKVLNSFDAPSAWHAEKLPNGNYLVGGDSRSYVREFSPNGDVVWEITQNDVPFKLYNTQTATRLPNGNTLITNWVAGKPVEEWAGSVQFFEVTRDKKVVWQVSSWENPDLGPCTYLEILNSPRHSDGTPRMMNDTPNNPMGEGKGIHPGRVAWIHNPGVANWDGETGKWFEERWNSQEKADEMIREGLVTLTGEGTAKKAWKALFTNFNETHGRGSHPYRKGEKIAIKLNMNNTFSYEDNEELNSSPYLTLALLSSLIKDGGVRQEDITVCEPSRWLTNALYLRCKVAYPKVNYVDNVGLEGRTKADYYENAIPYSTKMGETAKGLAKCIVDADYLINSALLKIHTGPGVTLTGKNWYGATDINKEWRKNSHNSVNQDKRGGAAKYSSFVDFIGHKDLGGKCMLFLIDGTYGSRDVNGKPSPKWEKAPFNGEWCCSILMSQDPLAVDSVGLDMLAGEWPEVGSLPYCDTYLVEAASLPNPPSGTVYDPEQDGKVLDAPLGLHEHWNNPIERKYTAIDLIYKKIGSR